MSKVIKLYSSPECPPCREMMELINKGRFESDVVEPNEDVGLEVIDISSEEGFAEIEKQGLTGVPEARYNGKSCKIAIDSENGVVSFICGGEDKS